MVRENRWTSVLKQLHQQRHLRVEEHEQRQTEIEDAAQDQSDAVVQARSNRCGQQPDPSSAGPRTLTRVQLLPVSPGSHSVIPLTPSSTGNWVKFKKNRRNRNWSFPNLNRRRSESVSGNQVVEKRFDF